MRLNSILAAAAAFIGSALAEPSYDCSGSGTFGVDIHFQKGCDQAVNHKLIRNDDINYGSPESSLPESGACQGSIAGNGCGVSIRGGPECKFSGNQMWDGYQQIRQSGCEKCGFKKYDNGCEMVIDYVSGC